MALCAGSTGLSCFPEAVTATMRYTLPSIVPSEGCGPGGDTGVMLTVNGSDETKVPSTRSSCACGGFSVVTTSDVWKFPAVTGPYIVLADVGAGDEPSAR